MGVPVLSLTASNYSFKPNLLRSSKSVAEKACHAFASTTQVGLIQVLGPMKRPPWLISSFAIATVVAVASLVRYHRAKHQLGFPGSPVPLYLCAALVGVGSAASTFFSYSGTKKGYLAIFVGLLAGVASLFALQALLWFAFGAI